MKLVPELITADAAVNASNPVFHATLKAHGLYNTQQFVLRLSPSVHRTLASLPSGISTNREVGLDGAQAMSTYLHETIHWWQHIGSTYGFVLSLNYPVQSHSTFEDLKKLVARDGFKKSVLLQSIELNKRGPTGYGTTAGISSTIVNNHFDLFAFRAFTLGRDAAREVTKRALFENVGHAFHMTYGHTVGLLAATVDPEFKVLPHPKEWQEGFQDLREKKVEGHYYGSPVKLWPVGAYEIFEGQAQFSQIQYLSFACGHRLDWNSYHGLGMLKGVYARAFEEFLRLTESEWPTRVNDSLVGLFLLVCDLAINPASGFPVSMSPNFETFVDDVHPGARFTIFCRLIARSFPEMKVAVKLHNRAEYESIAAELCGAAKEVTPLLTSEMFSVLFTEGRPFSPLRNEYESYDFHPGNYVLRHLFAHFLAFQEDKFKHPEFFCWPGAWTAGENVSDLGMDLFDKHGALFVDKEDHDGVFPRIQKQRSHTAVQKTFDAFYHNQVIYDLTNQWISKPGVFTYDFDWLAPSKAEEVKEFLRKQFTNLYGIDPEEIQVLEESR